MVKRRSAEKVEENKKGKNINGEVETAEKSKITANAKIKVKTEKMKEMENRWFKCRDLWGSVTQDVNNKIYDNTDMETIVLDTYNPDCLILISIFGTFNLRINLYSLYLSYFYQD